MNGLRSRMQSLQLLLIAAAAGGAAAAELTPALEACASERDDERRLACYDAEVARIAGLEPVAAREPGDSSEASTAKSRQDERQPGSAADAVDRFGMTAELADRIKEQGEPEKLESLTAVVTRIDEKPYGERIVYLDNGQVWEEISTNRNLPLAVGDEITVKSAALGSFKLVGPGGKRFTRVQRIR